MVSVYSGFVLVGERCIEFLCYYSLFNIIVNLLVGIYGVEYMNIVYGVLDIIEFFCFFGEVGSVVNI